MPDNESASYRQKPAMIAALALAMATICLAALLCSLCALKSAVVERKTTKGVELRIREAAGYWHWLVFDAKKTGIEAFDAYQIEFFVNEYSSLDPAHIATLRFVIDGKEYDADYTRFTRHAGVKEEKAYQIYFTVDEACLTAMAKGRDMSARMIDGFGQIVEYSITEPERFREAAKTLF
jgi:hypothetical protein